MDPLSGEAFLFLLFASFFVGIGFGCLIWVWSSRGVVHLRERTELITDELIMDESIMDDRIHSGKAFLLVVLDELERAEPFDGKEQLREDIWVVLHKWMHLDSCVGNTLDGKWIGSANEEFIDETAWAIMQAVDAWIGRDACHALWRCVDHCVGEFNSGNHEFLMTEANVET